MVNSTQSQQILPNWAGSYNRLTNQSDLQIELTEDGQLFAIRHHKTLINQLLPDSVESGLIRLIVRLHRKDGSFEIAHAIGCHNCFEILDARTCVWKFETPSESEVLTTLALHPELSAWAFDVEVVRSGSEFASAEVMLFQDIGIADQTSLRMNEAYNSHYIDFQPLPFGDPGNWAVCARQNQADSSGKYPWIIMSCTGGARYYATDGFQVWNEKYRYSSYSGFEKGQDLPSQRLQYEFAGIALQSSVIEWDVQNRGRVTFVSRFLENHSEATSMEDVQLLSDILPADWLKPVSTKLFTQQFAQSLFTTAPVLHGEAASDANLERHFPDEKRFEERKPKTGELLSFFYNDHSHVVTQEKEILSQRSHGHILRSGDTDWVDADQLGITCYADGMFGAQCFFGNPNLTLLYSVRRNALHLQRSSGQRVFVNTRGGWKQLGIPTFFEMKIASVRWIYCWDECEVEVNVTCDQRRSACKFEIHVLKGTSQEFLITQRLVLGSTEGEHGGSVEFFAEDGVVILKPDEDTLTRKLQPDVGFAVYAECPKDVASMGMDEMLYSENRRTSVSGRNFLVIKTRSVSAFGLFIAGSRASSVEFMPSALNRMEISPAVPTAFNLRIASSPIRSVGKLNEILPWFNHNAGIHFSSPHGLEQYGGSAWGVRDVCQGSIEWLLASRRIEPSRKVILEVFRHQYLETGNWPQWFMHGAFEVLQQVHSHGDICFWPLKALCDYIENSNDFTILQETVDYTDQSSFGISGMRETVIQHCDRVIELFRSRLSSGTHLVIYGEGDWDDTLQPADRTMCTRMVSAWTVALSYHVFRQLSEVYRRAGESLRSHQLTQICEAVGRDFRKYLAQDGIVSGFGVRAESGFKLLLHPADRETGIQYRLLPMTRSILAELFDFEETNRHLECIREHLLYPDGARLMNCPATYKGGIEQMFKRADTAANVGREIGLMYVHAHIRYAEALAKVGDANGLWRALQVINPILLDELVPNAELRQSNAFFSSSDASFPDRYCAKKDWEQLKDAAVSVKGGWRVYSSSPGLFLNKVRGHLFGIREYFEDIVFDPVLPGELNGLEIELDWSGKPLSIEYRLEDQEYGPKSITLNGVPLSCERRQNNPYRQGGVLIPRSLLESGLVSSGNQMLIRL